MFSPDSSTVVNLRIMNQRQLRSDRASPWRAEKAPAEAWGRPGVGSTGSTLSPTDSSAPQPGREQGCPGEVRWKHLGTVGTPTNGVAPYSSLTSFVLACFSSLLQSFVILRSCFGSPPHTHTPLCGHFASPRPPDCVDSTHSRSEFEVLGWRRGGGRKPPDRN